MTASNAIAAANKGFDLSGLFVVVPTRLTVAGAMKDGRYSTNRDGSYADMMKAGSTPRRGGAETPVINSLACTCTYTRESVALVGSAFTPTLAVRLGRFLPRLGWWGANPASLFLSVAAQAFHNAHSHRSQSLHPASLLSWTQSSTKEADKCAGISRQIVQSTKS